MKAENLEVRKKTPRRHEDVEHEDIAGGRVTDDSPRSKHGEKLVKAQRHDIDLPPTAEVDVKLADILESTLKLGDCNQPTKSKFFLHKLRYEDDSRHLSDVDLSEDKILSLLKPEDSFKLKARNLSREQLKERLLKKYDTLVPELDPKRPQIKLIKVLSVKESVDMAKDEARRQLERQLKLGSIHSNQQANSGGTSSFRFDDGYEIPEKKFSNYDQREA